MTGPGEGQPQTPVSVRDRLKRFAAEVKGGQREVGVKTGEQSTEEDKKSVLGEEAYKKAKGMREQETPKPND